MSKYFKSLKHTHIPFDPEEPKILNEEIKEYLEDVGETEADMLKRLREEKGWGWAQLANKIGITEGVLKKMEAGELPIPYETAMQLGEIFNIDPRFFLR